MPNVIVLIAFSLLSIYTNVNRNSVFFSNPHTANDSTIKIDQAQAFYIWKSDKRGCMGLRSRLVNTISNGLMDKDRRYIISQIGRPDFETEYEGNDDLEYFTGSTGCKECKTCSLKKFKEYGGAVFVLQLKFDSALNAKVLKGTRWDIVN